MAYSDKVLSDLFDKFDGCCSFGGRNLIFSHYGKMLPTGWEVDHGVAMARGGVDDGRNLRVACWACNHLKLDMNADEWMYRVRTYYDGQCPRWYNGQVVVKHPL